MHLLGCLDTPTSGTMHIDGIDVSRASSNRLAEMRNQKIGFVFQSFNLLPKFTVLQNVELPMIYAGVSARERHDRALDAIERVELENRMKNTPLQLSGGQMQRVAIARALVNGPKIIFADEPTGNLDSKTGANILELFRELSEQGRTIVLVTHDNKIAAQTPRRIEIRDGQIVDDVKDRSSSLAMNLWLGFLVGLKEIWAHKFRSFLTMLGRHPRAWRRCSRCFRSPPASPRGCANT